MKHPAINNLFCGYAFTTISMDYLQLIPCCKSYLVDSVYDICKSYTFEGYINNDLVEFRKTILTGEYTHCSSNCPYRNAYTKHNMFDILSTQESDYLLHMIPTNLIMANDTTCNLSCKTCRGGEFNHTSLDDVDASDSFYSPIFKYIESIKFSGMGDPFSSKYYFSMLQTPINIKFQSIKEINIHTNGILFTEHNYNKIHEFNRGMINTIEISIDASTESTYKKVRGGDFIKLLDNLKFIRVIYPEKLLISTFTITKENFFEIPEFIVLCSQYKFNQIKFIPMKQWDGGCDINDYGIDVTTDEFKSVITESMEIAKTIGISAEFYLK